MTNSTDNKPRLCTARDIEYKAHVRQYQSRGQQVTIVFVTATCWYADNGGMTVWVEENDYWDTWRLMEQEPGAYPLVDTFHIASGTKQNSIRDGSEPREILIEDAHGKHHVVVRPWSGDDN
jgi:hypothetical protein